MYHFATKLLCKLLPHAFFNPFPNKPWFLRVSSASLLKTPLEKEKLLVTSNFFFHSVFYSFGERSAIFIKFEIVLCKLFQFGRVYNLSFGKWLNEGSKPCRPVGSVQVGLLYWGLTSL